MKSLEIQESREEIQDTFQLQHFLLDNIPNPVFQRDLKGIYINCNEKFARQILGLSREEVIGASFSKFQEKIPEECEGGYRRDDRKLLLTGGTQCYEVRFLCADDITRDFLINRNAYRDSSGKLAGITGVMTDITEQKRTEEDLRKKKGMYRLAIERTGHVVYDCDLKTGDVNWAGDIKGVMGYSFEEFKKFDMTT